MRTLVLPRSIKPISLLTKTAVMNLLSIWTTGSKMAQIRTRTFLRPIWIDFEIIRNFYDHQTEPESKWHSGGDSIHGQTKTTFLAMSDFIYALGKIMFFIGHRIIGQVFISISIFLQLLSQWHVCIAHWFHVGLIRRDTNMSRKYVRGFSILKLINGQFLMHNKLIC